MKMQYEAPAMEIVAVKQELSFCSPTSTPGSTPNSSMNVTYGQEDW